VLSVSERGKAAEYELYYIVEFDVTDAKGKVIVARQGLNLTRDYLYEVSSVISTDRQDRLLRVNLQKDMADLMMRRIQAQAK
jgi:LPS-assembly lipoprotein